MLVTIENKSDRNVTLQNIAGSFHHAETGKLVKNVCSPSGLRAILAWLK
jgi:hypothetical protein